MYEKEVKEFEELSLLLSCLCLIAKHIKSLNNCQESFLEALV